MKPTKVLKIILFCMIYGVNLLSALGLWLCGKSGNILLGILLIVVYRLSLWTAPFAVSLLYWLPFGSSGTRRQKLIFYFLHLLACGGLFLLCYLLFGNWY